MTDWTIEPDPATTTWSVRGSNLVFAKQANGFQDLGDHVTGRTFSVRSDGFLSLDKRPDQVGAYVITKRTADNFIDIAAPS